MQIENIIHLNCNYSSIFILCNFSEENEIKFHKCSIYSLITLCYIVVVSRFSVSLKSLCPVIFYLLSYKVTVVSWTT